MQARLAGAIGAGGTSLLTNRLADTGTLEERAAGCVFAASDARVVRSNSALCLILGSPKLKGLRAADLSGDAVEIDCWQTALLGPTAQLDEHLGGHFAIVYVELEARRVVLVSDRFSSYSLYYRPFHDGFAFADRATVLFDDRPSISLQALFDYLYFHCLPGPDTVHDSLMRLEPGTIVRWDQGKLTQKTYWSRKAKGPVYTRFDEAKHDFHRLLREAVAEEVEPGTTGAFLSGGTDSSTVVGLLAEQSDQPVKSYSIGFDVEGYDEASYAKLAAERYGTDHQSYYVTPDDLVANIPNVAANLDQPFGNSSLLPAMICADRAREDGITKLLAGDGGDELFGGNTRYAKQKVFEWYGAIPGPLRRGGIERLTGPDFCAVIPLLKKLKSYVEQANIPMPDRLETYNLLEREGTAAILPEAWLRAVDSSHPHFRQREVWTDLAADNFLDRMLEFDWKFTLADNDLRKVRYAANMARIHVGFPLLSDDLLEFSLRLEPDWKVKGLKLRWFFKRALSDFLPREIIQKKKHGFGLPFGTWALEHENLRRMTRDAIRNLVDRGLVRESYANLLMEERLPAYPSYYGELVWVLMMLELWLQAHSPGWRIYA
ncbi:asparagine synthetase B family protein [Lentisalinibacter orientalis]|uniref:asparagine synthetase B family protein n=1 Tax=Lentisalinibacter orientalis TaxID=2992241 RepID=UPI0038663EF4